MKFKAGDKVQLNAHGIAYVELTDGPMQFKIEDTLTVLEGKEQLPPLLKARVITGWPHFTEADMEAPWYNLANDAGEPIASIPETQLQRAEVH